MSLTSDDAEASEMSDDGGAHCIADLVVEVSPGPTAGATFQKVLVAAKTDIQWLGSFAEFSTMLSILCPQYEKHLAAWFSVTPLADGVPIDTGYLCIATVGYAMVVKFCASNLIQKKNKSGSVFLAVTHEKTLH